MGNVHCGGIDMETKQLCKVTFSSGGKSFQGSVAIEVAALKQVQHYRALITSSPLHGTYGGWASTVELALDFLNLAMQAEGADAIAFGCRSEQAA
jgi:hypothetical protein